MRPSVAACATSSRRTHRLATHQPVETVLLAGAARELLRIGELASSDPAARGTRSGRPSLSTGWSRVRCPIRRATPLRVRPARRSSIMPVLTSGTGISDRRRHGQHGARCAFKPDPVLGVVRRDEPLGRGASATSSPESSQSPDPGPTIVVTTLGRPVRSAPTVAATASRETRTSSALCRRGALCRRNASKVGQRRPIARLAMRSVSSPSPPPRRRLRPRARSLPKAMLCRLALPRLLISRVPAPLPTPSNRCCGAAEVARSAAAIHRSGRRSVAWGSGAIASTG